MAYTPTVWATGDVVTSAKLNKAENGIAANSTAVEGVASDLASARSTVAPNFLTTTAYAAGDYVYYNDVLYRFTAAHAAGAWTGSDATQVVLGDDVADLNCGFDSIVEKTKNLLPIPSKSTTLNSTDIVYADGNLTINGTAASNGGRLVHLTDDFVLPAGTYTFSVSGTTPALFVETGNTILAQSGSMTFTLTEDTTCYIGANLVMGTVYNYSINVQVEAGNTATSFYPPSYISAIDLKARNEIDALENNINELYSSEYLYNDVNNLTYVVPDATTFYWLGTAKEKGVITGFYGIYSSGVVPYLGIVRDGVLVAKNPLTTGNGSYQQTDLRMIVQENDDIFIGGAVGSIGVRSDSTLGITIKQFDDVMVGRAVTITEVTSAKFRYNCYVNISYGDIAVNSANNRKQITVGAGRDFTSLTKALEYAYNYGNCDVVVFSGTYDIFTEMGGASYFDSWTFADNLTGGGPIVGNGCCYRFAPNAKVKFNYTGSNNAVKADFSPINAGNGDFEIIGLNLNTSNCRYSIHDEMGRAGIYVNRTPVKHTYKNMKLYMDNTGNTATQLRYCIGGGLGDATFIEMQECKFESATPNQGNVYWHNYNSGGVSSIDVSGCDFTTGTFEAQYIGTHTDITECFVNNCKMALAPIVAPATGSSATVNISINGWNNVIE